MASHESRILVELFQSLGDQIAATPNVSMTTLRAMHEDLHRLAAEPVKVTYEPLTIKADISSKNSIPALWIKPLNANPEHVLLYLHGGGFILGSSGTHRKMVGHLAKAAGCNALLIDYRLAPEHPHPAALGDAAAAYAWLRSQGYEANRIAFAGDSAGGNLCIRLALDVRARREPSPAGVYVLCPWMNLGVFQESEGSIVTNAEKDKLISAASLELMARSYVDNDLSRLKEPEVSPLYANLEGLPPVYVVVSPDECLYDDSIGLVQKAREARVEVVLEEAEGMQHVFTLGAGNVPEADQIISNVGSWLRECFDRGSQQATAI